MRSSVLVYAGAMLLLAAADLRAQWPQPLDRRLTVSVNGGGQAGSTDVSRRGTFSLYGENATIEAAQTTGAGGVFDIGASYRIGRIWGVGLAYTTTDGSHDVAVAGALPHPLFFNRARTFSADVPDARTNESAVHLQAVVFVPFTDKVDFAFAVGPSFFSVDQDFVGVSGVSFTEVPPDFNSVRIDSLAVVRRDESATGFNLSGEATYAITEGVGAGLLLRYTRASVDYDVGDGTSAEVDHGGFQALVGVRLRF